MKGLKITLTILTLVFGCFAVIGVIMPSVEYGVTVHATKDPQTVWKVMSDQSLMGEWIEGFKSIELTSGERYAEGSTNTIVIEQEGEEFVIYETVTVVKEAEQLSMNIENDVLTTVVDIMLEPGPDGGTKITTHNVATGKSWFFRSLFPLMKGSFQDEEAKHYNALAELSERSDLDIFLDEQSAEDAVESSQ